MNSFNIIIENLIHESILLGFPESSDDCMVKTYFILQAKHYIYLENWQIIIKQMISMWIFLSCIMHQSHCAVSTAERERM